MADVSSDSKFAGGGGGGGASSGGDGGSSFEAIAPQLQETIVGLQGKGELMAGFTGEFEKLYRLLEKSHSSEQRMANKTKTMLADIHKKQEAFAKAKTNQEDEMLQKKKLEDEIAQAFQDVAATHNVVLEKRQRSNDLAANIERLDAALAAGSGWTDDQKESKGKLEEQRDALQRRSEAKRAAVDAARKQVSLATASLADAEQNKVDVTKSIATLKKEIADKKAEAGRASRRKNTLDSELKEYKLRIEQYRLDVEEKQRRIRECDEQILQVENGLKNSRAQMDRFLREYDGLHQRTIQLTDDLDNQMHTNQLLANDLNERESEIFRKRSESEQVLREDRRIEKLGKLTDKKVAKLEEEKAVIDERKNKIREQLAAVQEEMAALRKKAEAHKKQIADKVREREILNKSLVRAADKTRQTEDLVKIHTNSRKNLENENTGYRQQALHQHGVIGQLQEDRKRYHAEAEAANQKYFTALEQVKLQELQVAQLQRKIVEGEKRLKQKQNLLEAVRSDRNLYSKNLIESQEEIEEMRRKFKIMNHQIDQLKEEITAKDHQLVKEHFDHHKVEKEKENLKNELTRVQKQIQSSQIIIGNQDTEMQKLAHIIQEADEERQRQQKEYDAVVGERDILGAQLIRRDEELSTLYEKIKIQKSTLAKGAAQFEDKRAMVAQLKLHIKELQQELGVSKQQVANISDLRAEVFRLERELLRERTKIKRLSEELEQPLNVHRWRRLEGSNPARFEMIRRIQALQKRLIKITEETTERDLLIQEKERLYVELKNILARQPGPEVAEQLAVYQQNLKQKQKQMRAMVSELDMYKSQVNEYKNDIERLNKEMEGIKQRFFRAMRQKRRMAASGGMGIAAGGAHNPANMTQSDAINAYMHGDLTQIGATELPAEGDGTGPVPPPGGDIGVGAGAGAGAGAGVGDGGYDNPSASMAQQ